MAGAHIAEKALLPGFNSQRIFFFLFSLSSCMFKEHRNREKNAYFNEQGTPEIKLIFGGNVMNIGPIVKTVAKTAAGTIAGLGVWEGAKKIFGVAKDKHEANKQKRLLKREIEYRKIKKENKTEEKDEKKDKKPVAKKKGESKE